MSASALTREDATEESAMEKIPNIEEWKLMDELERIKTLAGVNEESSPQYRMLTHVPLSELADGVKNNERYAQHVGPWDAGDIYKSTLAGIYKNLKENEAKIQQLDAMGPELAAILQILQDGYGGVVGEVPTATQQLAFVQEAMKRLSRLVG